MRWIASFIGYPTDCGGLLLSGGTMANIVCFLAARAAKAGWNVREQGVTGGSGQRLRVYGSAETHTWIQKAADIGGLGTGSIRWIPTDRNLRMDVAALRRQIEADRAAGDVPCMVVVSNAVVGNRYVLRACIVNFHTTQADVEATIEIAVRGRAVHGELVSDLGRSYKSPRKS